MGIAHTESGSGLLRNIHSDLAEACSNYVRVNKPAVTDTIGDVGISYHEAKAMVMTYDDGPLCFTLKTAYVAPSGADFSISTVIDGVVGNIIKTLSADDLGFKLVETPTEALKHSGLNSSHISLLRSIVMRINENTLDGAVRIHWCASSSFSNPYVGMVFKYAEKVFLLQLVD